MRTFSPLLHNTGDQDSLRNLHTLYDTGGKLISYLTVLMRLHLVLKPTQLSDHRLIITFQASD
jgi:hypothetical protein